MTQLRLSLSRAALTRAAICFAMLGCFSQAEEPAQKLKPVTPPAVLKVVPKAALKAPVAPQKVAPKIQIAPKAVQKVLPKAKPAVIRQAVPPIRAQAQAQVQIIPNLGGLQLQQLNVRPNAAAAVQVLGGKRHVALDEFVMRPEFLQKQGLVPVADDKEAKKDEEEEEQTDLIRFLNADKLHGSITGIEDGMLKWTSPIADGGMTFRADRVASVTLAPRKPTEKEAEHNATVRLTNGDELKGNITGLDEDYLVLDTWYAGELKIHRVMVASVVPNSGAGNVLYEGPNAIGDFQQDGSYWAYSNGKLMVRSNGTIGKKFEELPDQVKFDFTVSWQNYSSFNFSFFADNPTQTGGNAYMLSVRSTNLSVTRYSRSGPQRTLWSMHNNQIVRGGNAKVKFTLMADIKENKFVLMLNGKPFKTWEDPDAAGTIEKGNAIVFYGQQYGQFVISDIKVSSWDGKVPTEEEDGEAAVKEGEDALFLANKDRMVGTIIGFEDNRVKIKSEFADLKIPLSRVTEITFAEEERERARRMKTDVRAFFGSWGTITVSLESLKDGTISGKSENFGKVALPLDAFKTLEFNIYDFREEDEEELEELFER